MPKIAPKLASKAVQTLSTAAQARIPAPAPPPSPAPVAPVAKHTSSAVSSPSTTASEPAWLTGVALKAAHEHTFATQRAKKAADRAKGKAPPRKAPGHLSSSTSASSAPPVRTAEMTSIWAEIWDARKTITAEDLDWPELPTTPPSSSQRLAAEYALRPTQDREVPLSALVRPVKVRGAKAKGAFSFIVTFPQLLARLMMAAQRASLSFCRK
jgi:hypothetical protein